MKNSEQLSPGDLVVETNNDSFYLVVEISNEKVKNIQLAQRNDPENSFNISSQMFDLLITMNKWSVS